MPLGKDVSSNMRELYADNKKKGKARGANGKKRSKNQMVAIAMHVAGKGKEDKSREMMMKMRAHRGA
jgi:hypothetical protein